MMVKTMKLSNMKIGSRDTNLWIDLRDAIEYSINIDSKCPDQSVSINLRTVSSIDINVL